MKKRTNTKTKHARKPKLPARLVAVADGLEQVAHTLSLRAFDCDGEYAEDFETVLDGLALPRLREAGLPRETRDLERLQAYFEHRRKAGAPAGDLLAHTVGTCALILLDEATALALARAQGKTAPHWIEAAERLVPRFYAKRGDMKPDLDEETECAKALAALRASGFPTFPDTPADAAAFYFARRERVRTGHKHGIPEDDVDGVLLLVAEHVILDKPAETPADALAKLSYMLDEPYDTIGDHARAALEGVKRFLKSR